jgi:hypothetical protein
MARIFKERADVRYCDLCHGVVFPASGAFCSDCKPWVRLFVQTLSRVMDRANVGVNVVVTCTKDQKMAPEKKVKKDVVKIAAELAASAMSAKIYEVMKPEEIGDFCLDVAKRIAIADDEQDGD